MIENLKVIKKTLPVFNMDDFKGLPICEIDTENIFIPDWNNRPPELPPILSLSGIPVLTQGNTSGIIAAQGIGKSSICESIAASYLNPESDCLGFQVYEGCKGIIYIDYERTKTDVWNSFNRMASRAKIPYGGFIGNVKIAGMRSIARLEERLKAIDHLLQEYPCSLLILDGAGDMVTDTNDLAQAIECRILLRELTVKYQISIFTSIHPNPGSFKPRGHIGSELIREAECILLAKKSEGEIRIITTDFEHGKNRNGAAITAGYSWSDEDKMFLSCDVDVAPGKAKKEELKSEVMQLAKIVIPPPTSLKHNQLVETIIDELECSETTAKRRIKSMIKHEIIIKTDEYYRYNV